MAFDIKTARPISSGFDISSAKPIAESEQPKDLYSQWGINITPEMEQKMPYWSAISKTGQEGGFTPALHFLNQAAVNYPRYIAEQGGVKYPEPTTIPGQILAKSAGIAGAITSPVTRTILKMAGLSGPTVEGMGFKEKALRGAGAGAATGYVYGQPMGQRPSSAVGGGIMGGILTPLITSVVQFQKWLKPKNQLKLAEDIRNSLWKQRGDMIEKYGKNYDEIIKNSEGKRVSLVEPLKNLMVDADDIASNFNAVEDFNEQLANNNPIAKRVFNLLKSFKEDPNLPQNMGIDEADVIQKYIKGLPSIRTKLARSSRVGKGQVDFTNAERILLNFADDIKSSVLDTAPELGILNKEYGQFMNNFKQIRPYLTWGKAITNFENLHKLDPEVQAKIAQTIPSNLLKDVNNLNRTVRNVDLLKRIGWITSGGAIGAATYSAIKGGR